MNRGTSLLGVACCALWLAACLVGTNEPIYTPVPATPDARTSAVQSETSMARIALSDGGTRLVVGYNDFTAQTVPGTGDLIMNFSLMGYAISDDLGQTWAPQPQLHDPAGVYPLIGDPSVASAAGVSLYVNVAAVNATTSQGVAVARSLDGAPFELVDSSPGVPFIRTASNGSDGPKVAVAHDASSALVVWEAAVAPAVTSFQWLSALRDAYLGFGAGGVINPGALEPPNGGCGPIVVRPHPTVAAGLVGTFYVAQVVDYGCGVSRVEVYRLAPGATDPVRVLSREAPDSNPEPGVEYLPGGTARYAGRARDAEMPALAVVSDGFRDIVVVMVPEVATISVPTPRGLATSEQLIRQFRVEGADAGSCTPTPVDLGGCSAFAVTTLRPAERIGLVIGGVFVPRSVSQPRGAHAFFPAVFTGGGDDDLRVGAIWYLQPLRGVFGLTDADHDETEVIGLFSDDAGLSYRNLTPLDTAGASIPTSGSEDQIIDGNLAFIPCASLVRLENYYGEYVSGAMLSASPFDPRAIGAWTDSRQGCTLGGNNQAAHQHVVTAAWLQL